MQSQFTAEANWRSAERDLRQMKALREFVEEIVQRAQCTDTSGSDLLNAFDTVIDELNEWAADSAEAAEAAGVDTVTVEG